MRLPQRLQIVYQLDQLDDVGFTPQLELPAVTIGLIRKFLPQLESISDKKLTVVDEKS